MFSVAWSPVDESWVATHANYESLSWLDSDSPITALAGLMGILVSEGLENWK